MDRQTDRQTSCHGTVRATDRHRVVKMKQEDDYYNTVTGTDWQWNRLCVNQWRVDEWRCQVVLEPLRWCSLPAAREDRRQSHEDLWSWAQCCRSLGWTWTAVTEHVWRSPQPCWYFSPRPSTTQTILANLLSGFTHWFCLSVHSSVCLLSVAKIRTRDFLRN